MDPREKPRHENKEIKVEIGPKSLQKMCKQKNLSKLHLLYSIGKVFEFGCWNWVHILHFKI